MSNIFTIEIVEVDGVVKGVFVTQDDGSRLRVTPTMCHDQVLIELASIFVSILQEANNVKQV